MKQSTPRAMTVTAMIFCFVAGILQKVGAQPDSNGFISIDCGLPGTASYVDDSTKLVYVPDAGFIDAGGSSNYNISPGYMTSLLPKLFHDVRSFPDGKRNCYNVRSLAVGIRYLIRASFMYGNYDGLNRPPIFDFYIGVNFLGKVNLSSPEQWNLKEAIVVVPDDFVQICLVNTGSGTPFISGLELRPLIDSSVYPQATAEHGLLVFGRIDFGPIEMRDQQLLRYYPEDPYDRVWNSIFNAVVWTPLSTTERVMSYNGDPFHAPSKLMQTAITTRNTSKNIDLSWPLPPEPESYHAILYFSEVQKLPGGAVREFDIHINDQQKGYYSPPYLLSDAVYTILPSPVRGRYNVSLKATANSTLPPIINAIEIFSVINTTNVVGTNSSDVSAITAVKTKYQVQKNWQGDPCVPNTLAWDGLTCTYNMSTSPRITGVNLYSSGLNGDISSAFANLKAIQYLNLSHNSLTGSIPNDLSQLSSLTVLDLTGNHLSGSIPSGLLKRMQDGSLDLRYGDNLNLCVNGDSSCQAAKGKSKLAVYISIPVVLVVVIGILAAILFCFMRRRMQESNNNVVNPHNETSMSHVTREGHDTSTQSSLKIENRRFTYNELKAITSNFQRVLGQGGFGKVYHGFLEDGTQVAIKLRSQSSNQGVKEFLAEAQILTRIHHKNLVSMIGYCNDSQYMALVYEYMPEGTLRDHISGNNAYNGICLPWKQRLQIALEAAQGLEYLHKGCNPPILHRDVKATNILLNTKLEAKIADFGLSKAFNHDNNAHISTNTLVGTPGYVDPEYQATMQPTIKSDVYSFGIVLLELITGKPAIIYDPEPINISHWVRKHLARGNIEGIVDACMQSEYDVNSVWKTTEIGLRCTIHMSMQRPTMTDVVAQLHDCIELENGPGSSDGSSFNTGGSSNHYSGYNAYTMDNRSSNAFEMEHNLKNMPTTGGGPLAR